MIQIYIIKELLGKINKKRKVNASYPVNPLFVRLEHIQLLFNIAINLGIKFINVNNSAFKIVNKLVEIFFN